MAKETPEGDFSIRDCHGEQRFLLAMTNESLMIQVKGMSPNFTFVADITDACALRDWLTEYLDALDQPNPLRDRALEKVRRQRDDVTAALNAYLRGSALSSADQRSET